MIAENWQSEPVDRIISLWALLNQRIVAILKSYPESRASIQCNVGKDTPDYRDIIFLAGDYVEHLLYHLKQLFGGSHDSG